MVSLGANLLSGVDNEAIRELRDSSKRLENLTEKLSKLTVWLIFYTLLLTIFTFILVVVDIPELSKGFIRENLIPTFGILLLFALIYSVYLFSKYKG